MSLAAAVNVTVETVLHRPLTLGLVSVEVCRFPSLHVRVGICLGHMYDAVQVIVLGRPSRNSPDAGLIVNDEKEPEIQMVNFNVLYQHKGKMFLLLHIHNIHSASKVSEAFSVRPPV